MVETLNQLLLNTLRSYRKDDFMLVKREGQYEPISTDEFGTKVKHLALGLRDLGFEKGEKLIILAGNSPEWVMTDFACLSLGGITVPVYISLVSDQIKYLIDDSDAKIVICSDLEQWEKVAAIRADLHKVMHYIIFSDDAPDGVLSLAAVMAKGKEATEQNPDLFEQLSLQIKPEDIATIVYTSGTTGEPKGVMLTHNNILSNVMGVNDVLKVTEADTVLSFLPLTHILERTATFWYVYHGMTIGFAESIETLGENLQEIRPHIMVNVPRALEKIYARIIDSAMEGSALKRKIFFWAVDVGKQYSQNQIQHQPIPKMLQIKRNIANKLVFSKVYAKTGGRVRFFISGGAALAKDIGEFFYALGLVIIEGYGLTETSPVITANRVEDLRFGTVGKPITDVEVKIADDGEILAKGPNIMKGYYKKEAATQEVFEGEWFRTGDIGHIDEDGFLVITDRKKDILVTSGGKNVAPQSIENVIKMSPYVANVVVVGDMRKFVSALVVPDPEKLEKYAQENNIPYGNFSELVKKEEIIQFVFDDIDQLQSNLASYEKVKKIALLDREFEIEKGEMTPSYKVKRNMVEQKYKGMIDALYME